MYGDPLDYLSAVPDPVGAYADHVLGHMNQDHGDATCAIIKQNVGIEVSGSTCHKTDSEEVGGAVWEGA